MHVFLTWNKMHRIIYQVRVFGANQATISKELQLGKRSRHKIKKNRL